MSTSTSVAAVAVLAAAGALIYANQDPDGKPATPSPSASAQVSQDSSGSSSNAAAPSTWSSVQEALHSEDLSAKLDPLGADVEAIVTDLSKDHVKAEAMIRKLTSFSTRAIQCLAREANDAFPCGQKPDPGRAFFAKDATPLHESINRALQIELAFAQLEDGRKFAREAFLNPEELRGALATYNPEMQVQAAELMAALDGMEVAAPAILDASEKGKLTPEADGQLLELVGSSIGPGLREKWLSRISDVLASDDPDRVFEVMDRLGEFPLTEAEFVKATHPLCQIPANPALSHNTIAIQRRFGLASEKLRAHATWQDLCSD